MSAYGDEKNSHTNLINLFIAISIMLRYGASEQTIHYGYGYKASIIKINVAIHNILQESGPTSFYPW